MSFNAPIARAFVRGYEGNSMNSSSRRSIDNDTTLADDESNKPVELLSRIEYLFVCVLKPRTK